MFSKPAAKGDAADGPPAKKLLAASLIAEDVRLRGDVATEGDLHLDGGIEGDLAVNRLTIGETGFVTGSIQADTVEIRGRVTGTIAARQVRLCATARVDGDITHAELAVDAGAHFEGRSLVIDAAGETQTLSVVAAE